MQRWLPFDRRGLPRHRGLDADVFAETIVPDVGRRHPCADLFHSAKPAHNGRQPACGDRRSFRHPARLGRVLIGRGPDDLGSSEP